MDDWKLRVRRLRDSDSREDVIDALWDLRDSAFDHPQPWSALTAETLFQALAEIVEDATANDDEWLSGSRFLARALERVNARGK